MILDQYPTVTVKDIDLLSSFYENVANGRVNNIKKENSNSSFTMTSLNIADHNIFLLKSGFIGEFRFYPVEYERFVFRTFGTCLISYGEGKCNNLFESRNYIMSSGEYYTERHTDPSESIAFRLSPSKILNRYNSITGLESVEKIKFECTHQQSERYDQYVRRFAIESIRELNDIHPDYARSYLSTIEDTLITRIILHSAHSKRSTMQKLPALAGTRKLNKLKDYMIENYNRDINLDDLARVANVSVKSIYLMFMKVHGISPARFLKKVRLEKARNMLLCGGGLSVGQVAASCGFVSLAHFARSYRENYGELPSETARSQSRSRRI